MATNSSPRVRHFHVEDLWAGGPADLRLDLERHGIAFEKATEGGVLFECPIAGDHLVHARVGDHADHVEFTCPCSEDSLRAVLAVLFGTGAQPEPEPDAVAAHGLRFRSPSEVRAATPAEPPWMWRGYAARGEVTLFAGRPKGGKSTLAFG